MISKPFLLLLVVALVLGGSLGGAFAGGVALGKSQGKEAARDRTATPAASSFRQQPAGQSGQERAGEFRRRPQPGQSNPQDLNPPGPQSQGQSGGGTGRQGFAGQANVTGTIEKVEGNTVTLSTLQGPLQVSVGADATIRRAFPGTLADLQTGMRVTVFGQRGEDGAVRARSILLIQEGVDSFSDGRSPRNQQSP